MALAMHQGMKTDKEENIKSLRTEGTSDTLWAGVKLYQLVSITPECLIQKWHRENNRENNSESVLAAEKFLSYATAICTL